LKFIEKQNIMADEKKEKWTNYLALTTVLIAVCATLSTFKGGGYSTRSLMNQSNASDQWAYYQSKSLKSYIFEMQKDNLEMQRNMLTSKSDIAKYDEKIAKYDAKLKQYDADKDEISKKAKAFEAERELSKQHSSAFGIAVIFLQISILLSSIAALIKRKYVWVISLVIGAFGVFYFFDGFFLFLK
jgi:hypothetical protein